MRTKHRKAAQHKRMQRDYCTHQRVIGKAQTLTPAEQTECALPVRLAWEALRKGTATGSDYRSLSDAIQICTAASEFIDPFLEETCFAAAEALCGIADRYERVGKLGVDAASLRDIPPALEFYEELLRTATAGQLFEWMQAVARAREGAMHNAELTGARRPQENDR